MGDLQITIKHGSTTAHGEDDFGLSFDDFNPVKIVKKVVKTVRKAGASAIKFAENAAEAAGHAAHSLVKLTDEATGAISKLASKVPFVGPGLHAVIDVTLGAPFGFVKAVADGERIDKAVLNNFKRTIADIQELAPYVQTVITFVPGVGQGVSGAIGASLALAEGQSLSDAVIKGIKESIPGGPVAQGAFTASESMLSGGDAGEALSKGAIAALPVDAKIKAQVTSGLEVAKAAATGKPVDKLLLQAAISNLGPEAQKELSKNINTPHIVGMVIDASTKALPPKAREAINTGIAVGNAKALQSSVSKAISQPATVEKMQAEGKRVTEKSEVLKATLTNVKDANSFYLGIGLMQHKDVTRRTVLEFRNRLSKGKARLAFDMALAAHTGVVTSKKIVLKQAPAKAGYYATLGMRSASKTQKTGLMKTISKNPVAYAGASLAISDIRKMKRSWWRRFKAWMIGNKS